MIIRHGAPDRCVQKEVFEDIGFLMANKKGGFFSLGARGNFSRYNGSFFCVPKNDGFDLFKVIEEIALTGQEPDALQNNFSNMERLTGAAKERFYMNHSNTLLYEIEGFEGEGQLLLDCRHIYDFSDDGRIYRFMEEKGVLLVEYTKYKTRQLDEIEYRMYLAVHGLEGYRKINRWVPKDYPADKKRDSDPKTMYVYDAISFDVKGSINLVMTYSDTKREALALMRNARQNYDYLKKSMGNYIRTVTSGIGKCRNEEEMAAYRCARSSLDYLLCTIKDIKGIYAGLPWFHQFWTRDEAIALGALIKEEMFSEAKTILFRQLDFMLPDGRISNRYPMSALGSADGVGWTFKRVFDLLMMLEEKGVFHDYMSKDDIMFIKRKLRHAITNLLERHTSDGLCINDSLETWMDTGFEGDTRPGFRIEIQALRLNMYRLMRHLCLITDNKVKYRHYELLEKATRQKVKSVFWHSPLLYDGLDDPTIRPNIFIAYHVYPQLLSKDEWKKCFDAALPKLWLGWGGLSSIDTSHKLFFEEYTGEDNRSYHRGDSWFFINNIAAMCMIDLDSKKYSKYLEKIIAASVQDILFKGMVAHSSELSSAKEQRAEASLVQAWSASTLIELLHKVCKE